MNKKKKKKNLKIAPIRHKVTKDTPMSNKGRKGLFP